MTAAERMAAIAENEKLRVATSPVRDDIRYLLKRCELQGAVVEAARMYRSPLKTGGLAYHERLAELDLHLDALAKWENDE